MKLIIFGLLGLAVAGAVVVFIGGGIQVNRVDSLYHLFTRSAVSLEDGFNTTVTALQSITNDLETLQLEDTQGGWGCG